MFGFGATGELPVGLASVPVPPPEPANTSQTAVLTALRAFLLFILPDGVEVIQGQDNRVPEPQVDDFVVMTPIRRERLSTTVENPEDLAFIGSISSTTLTVDEILFGGLLTIGAPILGIGVSTGTKITAFVSGGGGPGTYTVNNSQIVAQRDLAAGQNELTESTKITVQLDVHGPNGTEYAERITTALRSEYGVLWFERNYDGVTPLYADDARQVPFLNDQQQYEDRWAIEAPFQISPALLLPQEFADQAVVNTVSVDANYPS